MDFLSKINNKSLIEDRKATKSIGELEEDKKYKIQKARLVNTKFGPSVILELEDFLTFLPKRLTEPYKEHTDELSTGNYSLIFRGKKDTGKAHQAISFEIVVA